MVRFIESATCVARKSKSAKKQKKATSPPPKITLSRYGAHGAQRDAPTEQVVDDDLGSSPQALPIPMDQVLSVRALLHSAKGDEPSGFLNFVEEVLSVRSQKSIILIGDNVAINLKCETVEKSPEGSQEKSETGVESKLMNGTPLDVFYTILDHLDEASSVTLGLTCKAFWAIHKLRYPLKTSLFTQATTSDTLKPVYLCQLLNTWMGTDRHYVAIKNKIDGKFMTRKQGLDKVLAKNKGVQWNEKTGCWGIWEEEQELQYAPVQTAVFKLCHEKEKVEGKKGFKWQLRMETPKQPWVPIQLPNMKPRDQRF
ncbi:hypothetical protein EG329_002797 [Mollisiaceae sp. DMI_Dod_QoI]|nr:hypothetical protein EG329_002797 [Helotiales sp. DMI_Dod_QoI]